MRGKVRANEKKRERENTAGGCWVRYNNLTLFDGINQKKKKKKKKEPNA